MNRSLALAVLAVLVLAIGAVFLLLRGGDAVAPSVAPPGLHDPAAATAPVEVATEGDQVMAGTAGPAITRREELTHADDLVSDPEVRAALGGFHGRVIDGAQQPVAKRGVRIYRIALDDLIRPGFDLMTEPTFAPDYLAGEAVTGDDGMFQVEGVWPRAFYLLLAGIGSDAPTHRLLQRAPAPGEIVELGDVQLADAAIAVGVVVDEQGAPIANALVRAADVPGQVTALLPFERFDPEGCVLVREKGGPAVPVIEMPKWVKQVFDHLPIPNTRTAADGRFRLVGITPGTNMVATTMSGYLGDVKPAVKFEAGKQKDLGKILLKRGEELTGKVIDTAGKPVVGAEVVAGPMTTIAPVDFGSRIGHSDEQGKFRADGFPPGKVTVAARRGPGTAWVMVEPQPIAGDVVVTLPAMFALTVTVTTRDGAVVKEPKLRLFPGKSERGNLLLDWGSIGLIGAVDLAQHRQRLDDGRVRIADLQAGNYTLLAQADGTAIAVAAVEIHGDTDSSVVLAPQQQFAVRVADASGKGIRNAQIYCQERGQKVVDMPIHCGCTDGEGRLVITQASSDEIRVSAAHPRWGMVHGNAKAGQPELLLQMRTPGEIAGTLTEGGRPAPLGKWTIGCAHEGERGAMEETPTLTTSSPDGSFGVRALQPGHYSLAAFEALGGVTSLGGVFSFAKSAGMNGPGPRAEVDVVSAQVARVNLDATPETVSGPAGHVFGTVTVDGRLAAGYQVSIGGDRRHKALKVDDAGRFDFGLVAVGHVYVNVASDDGMFGRTQQFWNTSFELKEGEEKLLDVQVQTTSIAGVVLLPDGSAAGKAWVQAQGRTGAGGDGGNVWFHENADEHGAFRFASVPVGVYTLTARGDNAGRANVTGVKAEAGGVSDLRLTLERTVKVGGRVDLARLASKPDWIWINFVGFDPKAGGTGMWTNQVGGANADSHGDFSTDELPPGRYRAQIYFGGLDDHQGRDWWSDGEIEVGTQNVLGLVLVPVQRNATEARR